MEYTDTAVKSEDTDMPEDLPAKCKHVSVQTDRWGKSKFENLFDGFSETQMKTLLDILAVFVARRETHPGPDIQLFVKEHCKVSSEYGEPIQSKVFTIPDRNSRDRKNIYE